MAKGLQSRTVFWVAAVFCLFVIGIQFIRPELTNPPVTADLQAPPEVKHILQKSCYNCHSNETKVPWFDEVVPAYWLVASDVKEGRAKLNFSDIGKLPPAQQKGILYDAVNTIQYGTMPLPSYQLVHPESAVTPEELAALRAYVNSPEPYRAAGTAERSAADAEYDKWIQTGRASRDVRPAPNGIAFLPEYKNWKTISSTDRFDNGTIREVLGNDIAVKAIAENHINPWPDGTAFAKVAWLTQFDDEGVAHTGAFWQVEMMIRDREKYKATKGWGWARWRGTDLKPYGKDAAFSSECVNCHTPLRKNDYVFTMPIRGQQ
jgi:mono/diheme cytochrome c family protein